MADQRVDATPAARAALAAVRARQGGQVMFVQSSGCCAGSVPMCFPEGEFLTGPGDELLGDIDGAEFWIDKSLDAAWQTAVYILDVAPGPAEGWSLAAGDDLHFVTRSSDCLLPRGGDGVAPG